MDKIDLQSEDNTSQNKLDNSRKGKTIPGFAREVILKVAEICEQEANTNIPLFSLNAPTRRAAMYTGVSERTIQRIRGEDRKRKLARDKEKHMEGKKRKIGGYLDEDTSYSKTKKPSRRGQVIPNSARSIISWVIKSCYKEFQDGEYLAPLICRTRRTALYTGVSVRTIQRIKQESEERNTINQEKFLSTPGRRRKRSTFRDKIDDFDFHCIRMLIDDLILNKRVFPTCSSLLKAVRQLKVHFPYGEDTLFRLLHSKGFNWKSGRKGKKVLVEKEEIFQGRANVIRKIKNHEAEEKFVIYLDDKWIGVDEDTTHCDENGIFGAEGGICCSGRLIVLTEFSAMGMARRSFRKFRPNANHSEPIATMSSVEKWLKENLFPNIPPQSLIIMCTSMHSQNDFNIPNEYSTKHTLIKFLKHKKLKYEHAQTWADLYDVIKNYLESQAYQVPGIDEIIEKHGHTALRLPVYMSEFNPIELAYAGMKRYLRTKITSAKTSLNVIKDAVFQAVDSFQNDTFQGYVSHIISMEDYFLKKEKYMQAHYDAVTKRENNDNNSCNSNVISENAVNYASRHEKSTTLNRISISNNSDTSDRSMNAMTISNNNRRMSTNVFLTVPHSQIFYGKTIATRVTDKTAVENETHQPAPSYLSL